MLRSSARFSGEDTGERHASQSIQHESCRSPTWAPRDKRSRARARALRKSTSISDVFRTVGTLVFNVSIHRRPRAPGTPATRGSQFARIGYAPIDTERCHPGREHFRAENSLTPRAHRSLCALYTIPPQLLYHEENNQLCAAARVSPCGHACGFAVAVRRVTCVTRVRPLAWPPLQASGC